VNESASNGQRLALERSCPQEAGHRYQIGASLATSPGIELIDGRIVPIKNDALLRYSVKVQDGAFTDFAGTLDAEGHAEARMDLEASFPGNAVGQTIYLLFVTLEERLSRSDVRLMSNLETITITE
jgi:hypothetical protein